jgi:hypothetical protein
MMALAGMLSSSMTWAEFQSRAGCTWSGSLPSAPS